MFASLLRQPVGLRNELLNLASEFLTLSRFERFLPGWRLAQSLKSFLCKGLSDFLELHS